MSAINHFDAMSNNSSSSSSSDDDVEPNPLPPISSLIDNEHRASHSMDIENSRFSLITRTSMAKLMRRKVLRKYGGVEGVVKALATNAENGIEGNPSDVDERRKTLGSNLVSDDINLLYYFGHSTWQSMRDPVILILFVCSVLSLGVDIQKNGLKQGWQEGVARLTAIVATVLISSAGNFWPTYQCLITSEDSSKIPTVDVVRNGSWHPIETRNIVVGDIAFLKPGDQVPGDGLFIEGCSLLIETRRTDGQLERTQPHDQENPYLAFGGTVVNGYAKMVVTAVGKNKKLHTIALRGRLLDDMGKLALLVGRIVLAVAVVSSLLLLWEFLAGDYNHDKKAGNARAAIIGILATPLMIALTSRPESLVLAVKIGFAYAMKMMMEIKVLVRDPSMCHSIASITTLCVNKTRTLAVDSMEVARFWQGMNSSNEVLLSSIPSNILELLHQGIGLNTTQTPSKSSVASTTSSEEKAMLDWAVKQLGMDVEILKQSCTILEVEPFSSKNRSSGVLISKSLEDNITFHVHRKGAPDVIIPMCSHYYDSNGTVRLINRGTKALLEKVLNDMAENGLRCFAFAHRKTSIREYFTFPGQQRLILLGFVGLKNQRRIGTRKAVQECQKAGINVKLITGDSLSTARVIATRCGILEPEHQRSEITEGKDFRSLTAEERIARVDHVRVLASATPEDKFLMVHCLKQKGHVVACLGQGIGDVMALREANVALCFGTQGAEIAEACLGVVLACKDILLIVDILKWGRSLYDSIQAYTQFLITSTFVALTVEFVTMFAHSDPPGSDALAQLSKGRVPYPVFPLLWAKLITGTFSALVFIIKPPKEGVMRRPPRSRKHLLTAPLLQTEVFLQILCQVGILLCIRFKGGSLFRVNSDDGCHHVGCNLFREY